MHERKVRQRGARVARWVGPMIIACAVVMFVVTRERVIGFDTRPLSVAFNAGTVTLAVNARGTGQNGWISQEFYASLKWWFWWRVSWRPPMAVLMVPLWVAALGAAGGTWWGWRGRGRERAEMGRLVCRACGYDLAGVPRGGRCPECGSVGVR